MYVCMYGLQCSVRVDAYKFLLVGHHFCVYGQESTENVAYKFISVSLTAVRCLVLLVWMIFDMRNKQLYSCFFVGCCFKDLFRVCETFLCSSHLALSTAILKVLVVPRPTVKKIQLLFGRNPIFIFSYVR